MSLSGEWSRPASLKKTLDPFQLFLPAPDSGAFLQQGVVLLKDSNTTTASPYLSSQVQISPLFPICLHVWVH